jgi:hypothetical protein
MFNAGTLIGWKKEEMFLYSKFEVFYCLEIYLKFELFGFI